MLCINSFLSFLNTYINIFIFLISLIAIIISIYIFCKGNKDSKNKLFIDYVKDYSSETIYRAISDLRDFVNIHNCYIKITDNDKEKKEKLKKMTEIYENLYNNDKEEFFKLDNKRRIIANYYVSLNILIDKNLIDIDLIKRYWSKNSLDYLIYIIIPIDYYILPKILQKKIEGFEIINLFNKLKYDVDPIIYNYVKENKN